MLFYTLLIDHNAHHESSSVTHDSENYTCGKRFGTRDSCLTASAMLWFIVIQYLFQICQFTLWCKAWQCFVPNIV